MSKLQNQYIIWRAVFKGKTGAALGIQRAKAVKVLVTCFTADYNRPCASSSSYARLAKILSMLPKLMVSFP